MNFSAHTRHIIFSLDDDFFVAYRDEAFIVATMQKMERIISMSNVKCIQFREKNATDQYFITIVNGVGCNAYVRSTLRSCHHSSCFLGWAKHRNEHNA